MERLRLLMMFQSGDPESWISAAEHVRDWLNADQDLTFFDEGSTDQGSYYGDGEKEHDDDDDPIDPQDELLHRREDRDDWDYDDDGPHSTAATCCCTAHPARYS